MSKAYKILGVFVLLLVVAGLYFVGFAPGAVWYEDLPHCEIPAGGGSCSIDFILPEERKANIYSLTLDFDYVTNAEFKGATVVTNDYVDYELTREQDDGEPYDEEEYFHNYMYRLPSSFPEHIEELYIVSKVDVTCKTNGEEESRARVYNRIFDRPESTDSILICDEHDSENCPGTDVRSFMKYYIRDGDYQTYYGAMTLVGTSDSARCYHDDSDGNPETERKTVTLASETGELKVKDRDLIRFMVIPYVELEGGEATVSNPPKKVTVSYKEAEYPTDLSYKVEDTIETFYGEQTEEVNTLNIADDINALCNRDTSEDACAFSVQFVSPDKGGVVAISDDSIILEKTEIIPEPNPDGPSIFTYILAGGAIILIVGSILFYFMVIK